MHPSQIWSKVFTGEEAIKTFFPPSPMSCSFMINHQRTLQPGGYTIILIWGKCLWGHAFCISVVPNHFGIKNKFCGGKFFHRLAVGGWGYFPEDSNALRLLCTLFLSLLLYQLHLRASDIRSRRFKPPVLNDWFILHFTDLHKFN